jgi:(4-(4-[2-(gamma-L-glutamylamino)ethyl]phenoxymethyl)furan-2-yl)methanamine synthase
MNWIGLDIGGANLKAANGRGWACVQPFELWRNPAGLAAALHEMLQSRPRTRGLVVSMTGELCDAFRTKRDGVRQILSAVEQVADGQDVLVYLVDGRFVSIGQAQELPHLAAASNWHALAQFVCRFVSGRAGVAVDVGSTTTDIIPLYEGRPSPSGFNDTDRLVAGELVYSGIGRTPVCAITSWLPWRNGRCPVAAEFFATAADAYVILGYLPERHDFTGTADGRPLTKQLSRERLARMICADSTTFSFSDAECAALNIREAQFAQLACALEKVIGNMDCQPELCVVSGSGEFLAKACAEKVLPTTAVISLSEFLGPAESVAAPAHALAVIAGEAERPGKFLP